MTLAGTTPADLSTAGSAKAETVAVVQRGGVFYATVGTHTETGAYATIAARKAAAAHFGVPETAIEIEPLTASLSARLKTPAPKP